MAKKKKKKNSPNKRRKPVRKALRQAKTGRQQGQRWAKTARHSKLSDALGPVGPERCRAPIHLDAQGAVVPDPRALLGLDAGALDRAAVRTAWRERLQDTPPELDPEGARRLGEARDRLLAPQHVVERLIGEVAVPDPQAWGLTDPAPSADTAVDLEARLVAQTLIYALVEDELSAAPLGSPEQRSLFG